MNTMNLNLARPLAPEAPASTSISESPNALYTGEAGKAYYEWQAKSGLDDARYNRHFFSSWVDADDDVLDFGCGGGFVLETLQARRKVGVEINPAGRAQISRFGIENYESVEGVPGLFDRIISSHALEHVASPHESLTRLRLKLRDEDSRLILLLPLDDWRTPWNREYRPGDSNMHLYAWTPLMLGNLLHVSGFEVCDVRVVTHAWPKNPGKWWDLSPRLFHLMASWTSWKTGRRQLFAVARKRI
jgi:SAM-dependent methyltransferase